MITELGHLLSPPFINGRDTLSNLPNLNDTLNVLVAAWKLQVLPLHMENKMLYDLKPTCWPGLITHHVYLLGKTDSTSCLGNALPATLAALPTCAL